MAETCKNLYQRLVSFENLLLASRKARKGKRFKQGTAFFEVNLERELLKLQSELSSRTWRPGGYRRFFVHESKKRLISAAPYRDRVVHHALCKVIEPLFEKSFIYDSYANRAGKGTHKGLLRLTGFCRRARYALKCDISKYFESVDRDSLLRIIAGRIADKDVLWLVAQILASGEQGGNKGLPIGNLTSQFFANLYLDGFDHYVKEVLRCKFYLRYVDDFIVLHDSKEFLHRVKAAVEAYLAETGLKLHPRKTRVFPVTEGIEFLGFKVFPSHRRLLKRSFFHFRRVFRRKAAACRAGTLPLGKLSQSARSWAAHAAWGATMGLRKKLFSEVVV